jgi:hypothetical protein
MEISVEIQRFEQKFKTKIRGVTYKNTDGTDRQELVKMLAQGEILRLVREPENPYDKWAIAVYNSEGKQLGYLPKGDLRLASHIDTGGIVSAKVLEITGGPGILGMFFKSFRKPYDCLIEITKGDFNWKEVTPFMDKDREIDKIVDLAKKHEKDNSLEAIELYRKSIKEIHELDSLSPIAKAWRTTRYPINRLSLLLEKSKQYHDAYNEILKYEKHNDCTYGISDSDKESIRKRKIRLENKLNIKQ